MRRRTPKFCCSECAGRVPVTIRCPRRRIAQRFSYPPPYPPNSSQLMKQKLICLLAIIGSGLLLWGCSTPDHSDGSGDRNGTWLIKQM